MNAGNLNEQLELLKELSTSMIKIYRNTDKITSDNFTLSTTKLSPSDNKALYIKDYNSRNIIGILNEIEYNDLEELKDVTVPSNNLIIVRRAAFFLCSPENPFLKKMFTDYEKIEIFDIPDLETWDEELFQLSLVLPEMYCVDILELYKSLANNITKDFYIAYEHSNYSTELLKNALKDVRKFIRENIDARN